MTQPSKRPDRTPRVLRQPSNGIVGYEDESPEEQMRSFADLIERSDGKAVRKLWPKLDPCARSYVMEQLGCFAGGDCPQSYSFPSFKASRAVGPLVDRQIKTVKKFLEATEESTRRLANQGFYVDCYEGLLAHSRSALAILENIKTVTAKHFNGPSDREIRSMIQAQEFVKRRSAFLGSRATLTVAAIADILELNEVGQNKDSQVDEGSIGRALRRFRAKPGYQEYMDAMGELLRDWTLQLPSQESDK